MTSCTSYYCHDIDKLERLLLSILKSSFGCRQEPSSEDKSDLEPSEEPTTKEEPVKAEVTAIKTLLSYPV